MNTEITETTKGWVLYDGQCAFCRGWLSRSYRLLRRRGFKFATLQSPWVSTRFGLNQADLLQEMRLILADGRKLGGADALIEIARSIWWARPLYLLSRFPGAKQVLRATYRWIARNRHCLGGSCRVPNAHPKHSPDHSVTSGFYELP